MRTDDRTPGPLTVVSLYAEADRLHTLADQLDARADGNPEAWTTAHTEALHATAVRIADQLQLLANLEAAQARHAAVLPLARWRRPAPHDAAEDGSMGQPPEEG